MLIYVAHSIENPDRRRTYNNARQRLFRYLESPHQSINQIGRRSLQKKRQGLATQIQSARFKPSALHEID